MDTESLLKIQKQKSWGLIILLSLLSLQVFLFLLLVLVSFVKSPSWVASLGEHLLFLVPFGVILYFLTTYLAWRWMGIYEIQVVDKFLTLIKRSPLSTRSTQYDLDKIRTWAVVDNTMPEGPLAMLQLLGIADKITLTMEYDGKTKKLMTGNDRAKWEEVCDDIRKKLG